MVGVCLRFQIKPKVRQGKNAIRDVPIVFLEESFSLSSTACVRIPPISLHAILKKGGWNGSIRSEEGKKYTTTCGCIRLTPCRSSLFARRKTALRLAFNRMSGHLNVFRSQRTMAQSVRLDVGPQAGGGRGHAAALWVQGKERRAPFRTAFGDSRGFPRPAGSGGGVSGRPSADGRKRGERCESVLNKESTD